VGWGGEVFRGVCVRWWVGGGGGGWGGGVVGGGGEGAGGGGARGGFFFFVFVFFFFFFFFFFMISVGRMYFPILLYPIWSCLSRFGWGYYAKKRFRAITASMQQSGKKLDPHY